MQGFADRKPPEYSHTQKAPLCLILYGVALGCSALGCWVGDVPGMYVAGGVGLLGIRHPRSTSSITTPAGLLTGRVLRIVGGSGVIAIVSGTGQIERIAGGDGRVDRERGR